MFYLRSNAVTENDNNQQQFRFFKGIVLVGKWLDLQLN